MTRTKREPQEILDVAKGFGQVCVRVPRADGRRASKVFPFENSAPENAWKPKQAPSAPTATSIPPMVA